MQMLTLGNAVVPNFFQVTCSFVRGFMQNVSAGDCGSQHAGESRKFVQGLLAFLEMLEESKNAQPYQSLKLSNSCIKMGKFWRNPTTKETRLTR